MNKKVISANFTHHPEYVRKIAEGLALSIQKKYGVEFKEGEQRRDRSMKNLFLGEQYKSLTSPGISIQTSQRNKHDNTIIIEFDKDQHPDLDRSTNGRHSMNTLIRTLQN